MKIQNLTFDLVFAHFQVLKCLIQIFDLNMNCLPLIHDETTSHLPKYYYHEQYGQNFVQ